jgi:hypothetical protein
VVAFPSSGAVVLYILAHIEHLDNTRAMLLAIDTGRETNQRSREGVRKDK